MLAWLNLAHLVLLSSIRSIRQSDNKKLLFVPGIPTDPLTTSELQNPSHDISELLTSPDFDALKLCKRFGRYTTSLLLTAGGLWGDMKHGNMLRESCIIMTAAGFYITRPLGRWYQGMMPSIPLSLTDPFKIWQLQIRRSTLPSYRKLVSPRILTL